MYLDDIRDFALSLDPEIDECFPFGPETFVYKTSGKIFLLMSFDDVDLRLNLKCEPELAIELRERYPAIIPGYHMNKKHWNTLILDGSLGPDLVKTQIRQSFELVHKKPAKQKQVANRTKKSKK
jgi:predicted DNA-binding protein (MmcQ/YjbR family)